ncbi:Movement protein [Arachis hypogaea]|nr:Movement protein [Arachis hypogaea]
MSNLFRSLSRRLSIRGFSSSSSSTSLPNSPSNPLIEEVTRPEELSPKHNIFEEEVYFKDINQAIDNWEIHKIPHDELYIPDDNKRKSDYIIKTVKNNIPLGPDSGEEFHLLTKQSVREHARHYKYLHIGCVQVAVKPLIREGSIPAALIYRIQYKVMNTCNSKVLLKFSDRETTLFVTDMTMANVTVPRLIKWDEIDLPQSWSID